MDQQSNRDRLFDYAKNSQAFGKLSMRENADLVMFYCSSFLKDNVYAIKSLAVIVVAKFDGNRLHLWDVFSLAKVELAEIVSALVTFNIDEIVLGFTPEDCRLYQAREFAGEDVLFIKDSKPKLFEDNKLMFPLLSHA